MASGAVRRVLSFSLGVVIAGASGLAVSGPAHAAPTDPPLKRTQTRILASELRTSSRSGAESSGKARHDVDDYLKQRASQGTLIDRASVRYATVTKPGVSDFSVVWDGAATPDDIYIVSDDYGVSAAQTVGFAISQDSSAAAVGTTSAGAGFESGVNLRGMTRLGGRAYCTTLYWNPAYTTASTGSQHKVSSCYEKWRYGSTNRFIYNRWGLLTRAIPASGIRAQITDFTLRNRPWSGYAFYINYMDGWTPSQGSTRCTEVAQAKLSAGPGELQIPMHKCAANAVLPDTNTFSMGMDFDGRSESQLYLDYGMSLGTNSIQTGGYYTPFMSDYTWFTVASCGYIPLVNCYVNYHNYIDKPGW